MAIFDDHNSFRSHLIDTFERQVFGPTAVSSDQDKGECLPISYSPLVLYATGVLFPQKNTIDSSVSELEPDADTSQESIADLDDVELSEINLEDDKSIGVEPESSISEPLNLANEFNPAAMGLSFQIGEAAVLEAHITFGTYHITKVAENAPETNQIDAGETAPITRREKSVYQRIHHESTVILDISGEVGKLNPIPIDNTNSKMTLNATVRR